MSGGGPLIDIGVHRLDLALWWMGYPEPVTVSGAVHNEIAAPLAKKQRKHYDVEDVACGIIRFANGASLILEASWALNIKETYQQTVLCGTKGGLTASNRQGQRVAEIHYEEDGCQFTKQIDDTPKQCPNPHNEFISSIIERREPLATGEQGLKVMKILQGIYKSAETGREVRYKQS